MAVLMSGQPIGALDSNFIEPLQSPRVDPTDPWQIAIDQRRQQGLEVQSDIDRMKNDKLGGFGRLLTAASMGYQGRDPSAAFSDYNQRLASLQQQQRQLGAQAEDLGLKRVMAEQQLRARAAQGDPAAVREYEYWSNLSPEKQDNYLRVKRSTVQQVDGQLFDVTGASDDPRELLSPEQKARLARQQAQEAELVAGGRARGTADFQVPEGYRRTDDGMEPISGSPADQKIQDAIRKRAEGMEVTQRAARTVVDDTQRALDVLDRSGSWAAGAGSYLSGLPGTSARALQKHIDSIKGNIGIDSLLSIKRSGAGLGQIPQSQLDMLASLMGNLDTAQSPSDLAYNLRRIEEIYADIVEKTGGDPKKIAEDRARREAGGSVEDVPRRGSGSDDPAEAILSKYGL